MSAALRVALPEGPIERTPADVVIVPLFAERPPRGAAGRADWRLCGMLSSLVAAGRARGGAGEAILVSAGGGLRAPLLLVLGVGERERFDAEACERFAAEAVSRSLGLGAQAVAMPLPTTGTLSNAAQGADAVLAGAAAVLGAGSAALELRLVAALEDHPVCAARLEAAAARARPDLTLSWQAASPRPAAPEPGSGGPPGPAGIPQLVK